ncbi:sensor histidine kinase [Kitasatospora mediocidica]|uniref:sensor histidine kinase n=1 Tax=Kitasatospora mediocidica TaxID=58352 RepID=UPI00068C6E6D
MSVDDTAGPAPQPPTAPDGTDPLWSHPLVLRLVRAGQRVQRADRERPWVLDTAVVVVVFLLFCIPDLVHGGGPRHSAIDITHLPVAGMLALQAALVLPLLWRRRAPTVAFALTATAFLVQWSMLVLLRADIALLIALYSLALHGRLRHLPWACLATECLLAVVALRVSPAVSFLDALFFLTSAATAAAALGLALRIRRSHLASLRERAARLVVERDQRSRLAAAAERTRMAREMHDIIGHNLSVIIGLADGGAYAVEVAPERGKEALRLIAGTGRQALGELRRMLGVLREQPEGAVLSPQPGIADLDALCERVRAAGPQVTYRTSGDMAALDPGVQLTVYRIVQEALTNTLKHAGPQTRSQLTVAVEEGGLSVRVEDTGPPDGAAAAPRPAGGEGHGIAGMRERATLYGGTVSAGPRPGGGWTVLAVLDLATPNENFPSTPTDPEDSTP